MTNHSYRILAKRVQSLSENVNEENNLDSIGILKVCIIKRRLLESITANRVYTIVDFK